jgi:cobalt-zinc-cadmium efflux system outer membrane protein
MKKFKKIVLWPIALVAGAAITPAAWAQSALLAPAEAIPSTQRMAGSYSLKAVFEQAWALQPEARSIALRRDATQAARLATSSWTAEPAALTLQSVTGVPGTNKGSRDYEVGLAIPLWLPGERARKDALGEAEQQAVESRLAAAQLKLAGSVREAWWRYQHAQGELGLTQDRLSNAQKLAADVARRFKAGDLSKADQHQADGAVAQAQAAVAEALGLRDAASSALSGWLGGDGVPTMFRSGGAEPGVNALHTANGPSVHPAVVDWLDQALVARRVAALVAVQKRGNPELTLAATRGRDQRGEAYQQTVTVGVRIPFGSGARSQAKEAAAQADALEAEVRANVERSRLMADVRAATARLKASESQLGAMTRHAELARDTLAFVEKAFRLGEADLPTRLRVELEAAQAERQLARTRTDAAAAVSTLRQALGLLPQ